MLIQTAAGSYRLHWTSVKASILGQGHLFLVTITPPAGGPNAPALVKRFGLTPREAQVAICIARGERNRAIALALGTSVHTVRRQVEQVLAKLGVSSRAAVAARIA